MSDGMFAMFRLPVEAPAYRQRIRQRMFRRYSDDSRGGWDQSAFKDSGCALASALRRAAVSATGAFSMAMASTDL
jgi:hypothetical protein